MPPNSTKICGAPRAIVSAAIVAPNISPYHSADARGFSLMMWTWSNLNAGLLIVSPLYLGHVLINGHERSPHRTFDPCINQDFCTGEELCGLRRSSLG